MNHRRFASPRFAPPRFAPRLPSFLLPHLLVDGDGVDLLLVLDHGLLQVEGGDEHASALGHSGSTQGHGAQSRGPLVRLTEVDEEAAEDGGGDEDEDGQGADEDREQVQLQDAAEDACRPVWPSDEDAADERFTALEATEELVTNTVSTPSHLHLAMLMPGLLRMTLMVLIRGLFTPQNCLMATELPSCSPMSFCWHAQASSLRKRPRKVQ